jgi:hypothetical protein
VVVAFRGCSRGRSLGWKDKNTVFSDATACDVGAHGESSSRFELFRPLTKARRQLIVCDYHLAQLVFIQPSDHLVEHSAHRSLEPKRLGHEWYLELESIVRR